MTDKLPPNLLALFAPRPALRWVPPSDHAPEDRKTATITGLAAYLPQLREYKETDVYEPTESCLQRKDRVKLEKQQKQKAMKEDISSLCAYYSGTKGFSSSTANHCAADKPQEDANIRGDAFKTLIVARLSYDATEKHLESEFGRFGAIERVRAQSS